MAVNELIAKAFIEANGVHPKVVRAWVRISARVGSLLPQSALMVTIQRDGRLDVLLRRYEDELAAIHANGEKPKYIDIYENLAMFSGHWMSSMYETCRLLKDRGLGDRGEKFASIFHELELVRMGLDKHEIPKDKKLAKPMRLGRMPSTPHDKEPYVYDKGDPTRSHIMPTGLSDLGSIMWQVIDHLNDRQFWVRRRDISDRIIELWKPPPDA